MAIERNYETKPVGGVRASAMPNTIASAVAIALAKASAKDVGQGLNVVGKRKQAYVGPVS